jgi:hypothetical protein
MQDQQALMYEIPIQLKIALVFPLLALVATFYHCYQSVKVWRQGLFVSIGARIRYNLTSLAGLFMVWTYYYWNLLGFNYYS